MDDTTSSFKIKLESTGNYRYSISPPPPKKNNNVEAGLDHFISSRVNKCNQGGARGGAIVVPNPRYRRSVSKKVQISILFVQDCNV